MRLYQSAVAGIIAGRSGECFFSEWGDRKRQVGSELNVMATFAARGNLFPVSG
jgi:hypothetical protein